MLIRAILKIGLMAGVLLSTLPSDVQAQTPARLKVVASFYPVYVMALNVLKDVPGVEIANLTPSAAGCLHDYALTTDDMKNIADADILIINGLGMEAFYNRVLALYPKLKIIDLSRGLEIIQEHGQDNPHVWVSVSLAIQQVENLKQAITGIDPVHSDLYKKNADQYVVELKGLRDKMKESLAPYRGRKIITFHEAFPYFAREFDLNIVGTVEREPGSVPNAQELAATIDLVKKADVKVIFSEPQYSPASAETIARETKINVYFLDPAVTGPNSPDAYVKIMEQNLKTLVNAFSQNN